MLFALGWPDWITGPSVTDWMQGVGALLAVPIAVWAGRQGSKAKKATERADKTSEEAASAAKKAASAAGEALGSSNYLANADLKKRNRTMWTIRQERNTYRFENRGTEAVKLINAVDVSDGLNDAAMLLPGFEGTFIDVGNSFKVLVEKSTASPAVTKIEVTWEEGAQRISQVYAV